MGKGTGTTSNIPNCFKSQGYNHDEEYKIEVIMNPHTWDNPKKPYFWCLFKWNTDDWCNEGCGWAKSQEEAFKEAYDFYKRFKLKELKDL